MESQSLSAGVNRIVQDEAADGMTVEEEIDDQSLDKMSIDTTFNLKQKIDLKHLTKSEANKIHSIIDDYPKVWAASKYSVGRFTGFDAHIQVMEGAKAWQKERRCPQEAGIQETMSGLLDSGVFELAEEDQDRYCANINIVTKPHKILKRTNM